MALGTGSREGRWKEEANNLLPGTKSISSFSGANGWEFGYQSSSAAKTEPCIGDEAAERISLAVCLDNRIKQARRAGMLCVAFVQRNRRLGKGQIRFVALLLVADAMLK